MTKVLPSHMASLGHNELRKELKNQLDQDSNDKFFFNFFQCKCYNSHLWDLCPVLSLVGYLGAYML